MNYPENFPLHARAHVESEMILAYRHLDRQRKNVTSGIETDALLSQCILRIFLVFARELCVFGQQSDWSVDRIDGVAKEFLRRLTIQVQYDKSYGYVRMTNHLSGALTQETEQQFRRSPEWKRYDRLLLRVAKAQMQKPRVSAEANNKRLIENFIVTVQSKTSRKITKKDIWAVAGYRDATEFSRFQRNDTRTTPTATANFNRVLNCPPEAFIGMLERKSEKR